MKVFISWSGERSRHIAEALWGWLPMVIQAVKPWLSSYDIEKGARWHAEMAFQLQEAGFGIICLTPENVSAPWVLFEAGALSKSIEGSRVVPYLYGFEASELQGPLVQFQAAVANKEDTKHLISSLNRVIGENRLAESILDEIFEIMWPRLEAKLKELSQRQVSEPNRRPGSHQKELNKLVHDLLETPAQGEENRAKTPERDYVFIVHGHNEATKEMVARFIEKLGMEAIVLYEQPSRGQTIIEKFESYSSVGYAVVLLTAADLGGIITESPDKQKPRARQNVIFELGYFIAKLGRNRVGVLFEAPLEIPSDYSGVIYIRFDEGEAWKLHLARELKAAGLAVDLNKIF